MVVKNTDVKIETPTHLSYDINQCKTLQKLKKVLDLVLGLRDDSDLNI